MFDGVLRYFSTVVPQLALNDRLVLLSCVAVAARQYTLVNGHQQHNDEQALTYYSVAIHRLSERLQNSRPDPAVFASCLLIAHCEMVESKATDWDLHLKGTGDLLKLHGWHGMSGGLAQAVRLILHSVTVFTNLHLRTQSFWIYCRMIILASLCAGKPTALELKEWIPGGVFPDPATWTLESWQKKVVFLLGVVQNFWSRTRDADYDEHAVQLDTARWKQLEADLMRHQSGAPTVASPLSILPPNGEDNPFQGVRYLNGTVSAAWQMLHTAFLILTICKPCSRPSRLSLLSSPDATQRAQTYARQIVGNTLTNRCSIAWANAVQLLTIAGQCLVVEPERNACICALQEIQERTGWNTRASVNRLNAAWENSCRHEFARAHSTITHVDAGKLLYHVWLGDERSLN